MAGGLNIDRLKVMQIIDREATLDNRSNPYDGYFMGRQAFGLKNAGGRRLAVPLLCLAP
jgi:hypothetical protein